MEKKLKYLTILVLSTLTSLAITLNIKFDNPKNLEISFYGSILMFLFLILVFFLIYKKEYFKEKISKIQFALASIFSIFMLIGNSYEKLSIWNLIFGSTKLFIISILQGMGYTFLLYLLINKFYKLLNINLNKSSKLKNFFDKNTFIKSLIIIIICWMPYIIAFYPAILSPDPSNQIKQFFGIHTKYLDSVIPLDPNVTITNHHPVIHTILLGGCVKIGRMISSDNLGLFIYSIIQISIFSTVLAYTIKYMKKLKTPYFLRLITLLIYALVPAFPLYAMSAVKDTIFTSLVIIYVIMLFELIKSSNKEKIDYKKIFLYIILILFIMLFRNNGIYLVVMSLPFLLFIDKLNRKKIIILLIVPLILFKSFTNILLPYLKITPGSIREMLSIPFQQTARYVKEHNEDITKEEKEIIDKILEYDTLADRYKPEIADPVKNKYNKYATDEDLKEYFNVWFQELKKYPKSYFEATINNTYGYYYPLKTNWYIYCKFDKRITENGFNYHYNSLKTSRTILSSFGLIFPYIPLLNIFVNIGFNVWLLIFMFGYLFYKEKYKELIYLSPSFVLVLVCIASPVNTYFRYALPYVFALMLNFGLFMKEGVLNEE